MKTLQRVVVAFAFPFLAAYSSHELSAQTYPTRPITIVWPAAAGASSAGPFRQIAEIMSKALGQPVLMDYRPGADGMVGGNAVVKAPPDGYLIGGVYDSMLTMLPLISENFRVQPGRDYAPLLLSSTIDTVVTSHTSLPFQDFRGWLAYAKANPGKLNYGTAATQQYLYFESISQATGISMTRIPYKGSAQALPDRLSGVVHLFIGAADIKPHVDSGKLNALAVTGSNRLKDFPNTPTLVELGFPQLVFQSWFGFIAPAGLPTPITAKVSSALAAAHSDPEVIKLMEKAGQVPAAAGATADEFAARIRAELERYGPIVRRLGLKME